MSKSTNSSQPKKISKTTISNKNSKSPKGKSKTTQTVTYVVPNQGSMNTSGPTRGITFSNIDSIVLAKALNFYLCYGICNKSLISAAEGYRLNELAALHSKYPEKRYDKAPSLVSHFYDVLAQFSIKTVSVANIPLVFEVLKLVDNQDRNFEKYITVTKLLCDSKKTLLPLQIDFAYIQPLGRQEARAYRVRLYKSDRKKATLAKNDTFSKLLRDNLDESNDEFIGNLTAFRYYLLQRNFNNIFNFLCYCLRDIFVENKEGKMVEFKLAKKIDTSNIEVNNPFISKSTTKSSILIWKALEDLLCTSELNTKMFYYLINMFYQKKNLNNYCLYTAILIYYFKIEVEPFDITKYIKESNVESSNLKSGKYLIDVEDYKTFVKNTNDKYKPEKGSKEDRDPRSFEISDFDNLAEFTEVEILSSIYNGETEEENEEENDEENEEDEDENDKELDSKDLEDE